jgi:hypothetical protein
VRTIRRAAPYILSAVFSAFLFAGGAAAQTVSDPTTTELTSTLGEGVDATTVVADPATEELAGRIRRNRYRAQVCRYTLARRSWRLIGTRPTTEAEQLVRLERWVRRRRYACRNPWSAAWLSDATCVHGHEGSWRDPNAPYWGGMQADLSFQRTYFLAAFLKWGTADRWPIRAQLLMAFRGWLSRGWYPWPLTARRCGLI